MANDVAISVTGQDVSGTQVLKTVESQAKQTGETIEQANRKAGDSYDRLGEQSQKSSHSIENTAESTDRLDTASSGLTSSLGALGSGFELVGLPNYQAGLEGAALATDFFSGVGEFATVAMTHLKDGVSKVTSGLRNWEGTAAVATKTTIGLVGVFGALYGASKLVGKVFDDALNPQINELTYELDEYAKSAHTGSEITRVFGKDLEDFNVGFKFLADTSNNRREVARWGQDLLEKFVPGLENSSTSLAKTRERVKAMDDALTQLVQSGRADEAQDAFNNLAKSQKEFGVSTEEVEAQLPSYSAALKEANRAGQEQTVTAEGQQVALRNLNEYIKGQVDPIYGLIDAQQNLTQKQKDYNEALKEHGKKSPEAKAALLDVAKAASDVAGKSADAAGSFNGKLTPAMRETYRAAGLTEKQIKDIENRFKTAKTAGDRFAKNYTANVRLNYEVIGGRFFQNGVPTFNFPAHAAGGVSSGGWSTINEEGQEAVRLPSGSIVYPKANASAMASGGAGGTASVELSFDTGGDPLLDAFVKMIRARVRIDSAGDSQAYFGQTG